MDAINDKMMDDPAISIGTLAEKVGLSVSALRKYETEGLLIPHRTGTGRRLYSHEDIDRVHNIKHMIQGLGLNIAGIRRIQALLPCWDLLPCDESTRSQCAAFKDNTRPCWTIKGLNCAPQGNECRKCVVYRFGSQCTEDIKQLLHNPDNTERVSKSVRELLQNRRS
ncbi:MAG: MerR family transcriptional regulator [Planctomycetota bacterium]|jgi:MerR family transcriptional regulator/heat shock protein HspR